MYTSGIVIYGMGECGRISADFFEWLGIKVRYFCDPYKENWGRLCRGRKIISPEELAGLGMDVPIFIASSHGIKIQEQLLAAGFTNLLNPHIHALWTETQPHVLEITTGVGCRVNCRFCCQETFINAYTRVSRQLRMSLETFKRCLDTMPTTVRIEFCGMSEPFLNPQCPDMIRYAHEKGHKVWFLSTLVGLSPDRWKAISDIPFEFVVLHLADEDRHSHIPITEEYKQLLQAVISSVEKTAVVKGFHCHGRLHGEIEGIVKSAKWGISYAIHDRAGQEKDASLKPRNVNGDIYCHHNGALFRWPMLLPDGRAVLCHCDCTMRYVLGNLLEVDYETLFNSPLIAELREKSKGHDSDILCRTCQDARRKDGANFPVWEVPKWLPFVWFRRGLLY